jgi:hypothetical protein
MMIAEALDTNTSHSTNPSAEGFIAVLAVAR